MKKQLRDHRHRPRAVLHERSRIVDRTIQKLFESATRPGSLGSEGGEPLRGRTDLFRVADSARARAACRPLNQPGNQQVDQLPQSLVEPLARGRGRKLRLYSFVDDGIFGNTGSHIFARKHPGGESVVEVGSVVCHLIGEIDQLPLQRRPQGGQITVQFRLPARNQIVRMLDHAFADFESEVQAGKPGVPLLETFHDSQSMQIVIEAFAETLHPAIQFLLACMGKWRMADVVRQCQSFREILVEPEHVRRSARDLRHLDGVRQAGPEMIAEAGGEDLGFGFQASKSARVDHPVAVALEGVAVRVGRLG
jgi:hypothetical protein